MQTGHTRSVLALLLSGAAVVAGGIGFVRQSARLAAYQQRHEADTRTIEHLRAAAPQAPACVGAPPSPAPGVRPAPPPGSPVDSNDAEIARRDAALEQLNRELADSRASVASLQAQLQSAGQEKQQALTAVDDLQKREREWSNQLDSLKQQLDSARAESQAARERAAALEADNARMKNTAAPNHPPAMNKDLAALQDIIRRRDGYLNSILRRYREITDQFRATAGTLDSSHGAASGSMGGIALSRIQNALSLAEDDMRRVNELNAQARQIDARLAK